MGIFISIPKTIECIAVALAFALFNTFCAIKPLGALQSLGYSGKKFLKWSVQKGNMYNARLFFLGAASLVCSILIGYLFAFLGAWASLISLGAYLIFYIVYIYADSKVALRIQLAFTPRFKRLILANALVFAVVGYVVITLLNFADHLWQAQLFSVLKYGALIVLPISMPVQIYLANGLAKIFEVPYNASFVKKAKKKVASSNAKIVAITGSYGKTSVKNILNTIIAQKYRVLSTPQSFNTPMGVARTINGNSLENVDVLIVEMGARNKGDISLLCDVCPPDYACITGVCEQHLETFKSLDTVIETKGEIIAPTKNCVFVAGDTFDKFAPLSEKVVKCDCVKDVVARNSGTEFTLCLDGQEKRVRCVLLGEHSAQNVALACSVAHEMGMSVEEICKAIEKITFTDHRLQLIKAGDINVIDDGYNSNPVGAKRAIEVLNTFPARKIVVTPGLVELGTIQDDCNRQLGANLVGLDAVILVGETLLTPLKEGYLNGGGDGEKLFIVPTLAKAQDKLKEILTSGDTVLFLNDLPDVY